MTPLSPQPGLIDQAFGISAPALRLRSQRLVVIASNIANAATPGYKARDLDADAALRAAQTGGFSAQLDSARLQYRAPLIASIDGNTVEMATEQAAFAENAMRYRASLEFLGARVNSIMAALKADG
ncbi:flagellar basal body rod protein FlgB [Sandarakinorhabdus cyanobacteriorum]|uniref:Flagellar basal body rod protein FlgB n=1 Tax=Sandarakinorhabdus cyanobacteriorum TaxID=1981098 RepID=A0A255Y7B0_9SPHN|nr:flagellar basal body rod protein FlgB [Sandarakinorhabdus cyanobacteriorum]OYQ25098.1 flagellar basal body rod protein FlgB [Sandarakinorhabdus cyanobacteriorum]